jgi:hypothetical protein
MFSAGAALAAAEPLETRGRDTVAQRPLHTSPSASTTEMFPELNAPVSLATKTGAGV